MLGEQQLRHRLADDVRSAEHERPRPAQRAEPVLEQHQAPERRAGHHRPSTVREQAGVAGVEAVHVLGRVDRLDHRIPPDLFGQRKLHQDAVDTRVVVQAAARARAAPLPWCRRRGDARRMSCRPPGSAAPCCAHRPGSPDPRRPAPTGEARGQAMGLVQPRDLMPDPVAQAGGEGLAVDQDSGLVRCFWHGIRRAAPGGAGDDAAV